MRRRPRRSPAAGGAVPTGHVLTGHPLLPPERPGPAYGVPDGGPAPTFHHHRFRAPAGVATGYADHARLLPEG